MTEDATIEIFRETGAIKEGHFVGNSGRHLQNYIDKRVIYENEAATDRLCELLATRLAVTCPEVVIAPAGGGAELFDRVARHLTLMRRGNGATEISALCTERDGDYFFIDESWRTLLRYRRIAVVDDILTTGGSLKKVIRLVRERRGNIICVGVLWNRGGVTAKSLAVPRLEALINKEFDSYEPGPEACPMCREGLPIDTTLGHGKKYLESLRDA